MANNSNKSDEKNKKIFSASLNFLSRREYSVSMLQKKLLLKGFGIDTIKIVLQKLIKIGLLDNIRFCEAFVAHHIRQGYGPRKIAMKLRQCGISEEIIAQQLKQNKTSWVSCLKKTQQKKFSSKPKNIKEKYCQIRYLHYRGFELDEIKKYIKNIEA